MDASVSEADEHNKRLLDKIARQKHKSAHHFLRVLITIEIQETDKILPKRARKDYFHESLERADPTAARAREDLYPSDPGSNES
ncbi:hypothetical protein RND71_009514 [Anisodus tanguticus]|uniref:Uncharacterized protein n=1 Tax=Anisodus tanguticus TaxID=243964 RepID=A0AAE1SI69_9SOLA|nr:hypothetical protein RND71_009514 [Anisodus tanguticus]